MLHAVIMAGGSGTRFWPASRAARPKQLLDLATSETMIQSTVARLGDLVSSERVLVVTNQRLVGPIRNQLSQLPAESILGEPCKRDTAPCVGLAAAWVSRHDPNALMAVMPADHVIRPDKEFQRAYDSLEARFVSPDHFAQMPRDGLAFSVEVCGEVDRVGILGELSKLGDDLLLAR